MPHLHGKFQILQHINVLMTFFPPTALYIGSRALGGLTRWHWDGFGTQLVCCGCPLLASVPGAAHSLFPLVFAAWFCFGYFCFIASAYAPQKDSSQPASPSLPRCLPSPCSRGKCSIKAVPRLRMLQAPWGRGRLPKPSLLNFPVFFLLESQPRAELSCLSSIFR